MGKGFVSLSHALALVVARMRWCESGARYAYAGWKRRREKREGRTEKIFEIHPLHFSVNAKKGCEKNVVVQIDASFYAVF